MSNAFENRQRSCGVEHGKSSCNMTVTAAKSFLGYASDVSCDRIFSRAKCGRLRVVGQD